MINRRKNCLTIRLFRGHPSIKTGVGGKVITQSFATFRIKEREEKTENRIRIDTLFLFG